MHLVNWLRHVTDPKKDENNQKNYAKDCVKDYEEMKLYDSEILPLQAAGSVAPL